MTLQTPEFLSTAEYEADTLRAALAAGLQPGVVDAGDLKVVQRGAGANMSVDVGAGEAFVSNSPAAIEEQLFRAFNDGVVNVTVPAAHATNPRIDQLILDVNDSDQGDGSDTPAFTLLQGTATSGATLDNRTGAAALPSSRALRLADILVPAPSSSVIDANIRDRRPWARGASYFAHDISGDRVISATGGIGSGAVILHTATAARIECSGAPLRVGWGGYVNDASASILANFWLVEDGAAKYQRVPTLGGSWGTNLEMYWEFTPTAGSHLYQIYTSVASGNYTLKSGAATPLVFSVKEFVRANANNGLT